MIEMLGYSFWRKSLVCTERDGRYVEFEGRMACMACSEEGELFEETGGHGVERAGKAGADDVFKCVLKARADVGVEEVVVERAAGERDKRAPLLARCKHLREEALGIGEVGIAMEEDGV
jgi:hypothetical protein